MFTSNNRDDVEDDDSILCHDPFSSNQKQHQVHHNHHQFSLFNLPSPYPFQCISDDFDYSDRASLDLDLELDLILFHHQHQQQQQQQQQQKEAVNFVRGGDESGTIAAVSAAPRMRSSKKDRHSKITTAQGPRDRRMRLSLEVAREFFDLQDMLGFDKASKTVEWLISQSKSAIKEMVRKVKGGGPGGIVASYDSDCEMVCGHNSDDDGGDRTVENSAGQKRSKKVRKPRRRDSHRRSSSATRESRRKARDRARERTLEKIRNRSLESSSWNLRKHCSSLLETGKESSCVQTGTTWSNLEILTEYKEIGAGRMSLDISSDLFCSKWSSAPASSSNLNLQEIGIPHFNQLRDSEQLQIW